MSNKKLYRRTNQEEFKLIIHPHQFKAIELRVLGQIMDLTWDHFCSLTFMEDLRKNLNKSGKWKWTNQLAKRKITIS